MQVATLFRETATLLGASMESQDPSGSENQGLKLSMFGGEMGVKQEPQDDGYETSQGELELRSHKSVKREAPEDPYSFVDDDPSPPSSQPRPPVAFVPAPVPKKRGRKKKVEVEGLENAENLLNGHGVAIKGKLSKDGKFPPVFKERKKHDRFNGMSEEEVSKRTLPDHLSQNLDIIIVGINPGLFAAYKGHHYAGPGNHFWKCLYLSGLTSEPMTADDDFKLQQVGIGFTNMVSRATKGSADLTRKEIKEGSQILLEKLQKFKPKIAVFNGKLIFEVFSGKKDFSFGRQPEFVEGTNTYMWVMPSSSARCAQLPRAADKVPFYAALKKFRDYLNGMISNLDEAEVVFSDSKLKNYFEREVKEEPKDEQHSFYGYGRLPNNGELTDLSNAIVKKDEQQPPVKKKRGRPKKIKSEGDEQPTPVKKTPASQRNHDNHDNRDTPKKKRGRPKKMKTEEIAHNGHSDHTNSSATLSNCFSPPIQSPGTNFQQSFSYNNQSQAYSTNLSRSPTDTPNYHQSPVQSQHYSQSPQPPSQPFTHSDLSSEISAAISSEHEPSPASPGLGPADFDPPASMGEGDVASAKEEEAVDGYRGYAGFAAESELDYPRPSQDVSSKSLSGLESLVDQIPSIAEGEAAHHAPEHGPPPEEDDPASYLYSPSYGLHQSTNFSVSALTNGSGNHEATNSFGSVSSLSSYNSYPGLMGGHMMAGSSAMAPPAPMFGACGIAPMSGMNMGSYGYSQYPAAPSYGGYPPSHGLHMPSPNYPYPSPYANSSYPQPPSYLPNHVLDRIKQDRMDIGFGGF